MSGEQVEKFFKDVQEKEKRNITDLFYSMIVKRANEQGYHFDEQDLCEFIHHELSKQPQGLSREELEKVAGGCGEYSMT